jgi:hypothetical protein
VISSRRSAFNETIINKCCPGCSDFGVPSRNIDKYIFPPVRSSGGHSIPVLTTEDSNTKSVYAISGRGQKMEEPLCNVEFLKDASTYLARVQSELGGVREYRSPTFEEVLEQVIIDLQEEFEGAV